MNVPRFPSAALGLDPGTTPDRTHGADARAVDPRALIDLPTREVRRRTVLQWSLLRSRALRVGVPLAIIVLWQLASSLQLVAPETLPSPTVIIGALKELIADGELQSAIGVSLVRAATGLAIGGGIGLLAGLLRGCGVWVRKSSMRHCRCCARFRSSR
ncbi:hypothetical protein [Caballeronia sp. GaOx3]|uniref:hypothetical protein n=1 Tax=Caballeronia sp. GaOx3 TaxID=2921740 RepID=UPI0020292E56|nr:hypothetical protein [Caballeronia sp. GaOx3]